MVIASSPSLPASISSSIYRSGFFWFIEIYCNNHSMNYFVASVEFVNNAIYFGVMME